MLLLLRAIYTKLSAQDNPSEEIDEQLKKIQTTLWRRISKGKSDVDYTQNFIRSECIDDGYKAELQLILESGKPIPKSDSLYTKNYKLLQKRYNKLYTEDQTTAEWMAYYLLEQVIVFSIEAKTQDAALTIFSTINNRGKSLTDMDIIRAKIYGFLSNAEKPKFNAVWRKLIDCMIYIDEKSENVFTYYMYYVRAMNDDDDSTMPGLKKYFSQNNSERLRDKNILATLEQIINLWTVANKHIGIDGEPWSKDVEIIKIFDMLLPFPNKAWRGAATVYYLVHRNEPNFARNFRLFMRKLFAWYVPLYILRPERALIRGYIVKLDVAIKNSNHPKFDFPAEDDRNRLKKLMIYTSYSVIRKLLLKAAAYSFSEQTELLPNDFQTEHIMPKEWESTYSRRGYAEGKFNEYLEQFGNFSAVEPKINKKASNKSFCDKKKIYKHSVIAMTRALIDEPDDWTPDSIVVRSNKIAESLIDLWQQWSDEYDDN